MTLVLLKTTIATHSSLSLLASLARAFITMLDMMSEYCFSLSFFPALPKKRFTWEKSWSVAYSENSHEKSKSQLLVISSSKKSSSSASNVKSLVIERQSRRE